MTDRPTTVHLLRHGEVHNPGSVMYGRLPGFRLSAAGEHMADQAAAALAGRDIALVVASPLERAQQTAGPVAARFGLPVEVDDGLIEAENRFEGRPFGVGDGALLRPSSWPLLVNPFRPSWGEPYADIAARMLATVAAVRDAVPGREAVLVSHQLPIWTLRRHVEGRPLWHRPDVRQCGLASLTSLTFVGSRVVTVAYREPAGAAARKPATPGA